MSTSTMSADELRRAVSLISVERFGTFTRIAGSEVDALALYQQTMVTAAALTPVIGMLEVAIRNAVCEQLRSTFGKPDWLREPPPTFAWRDEERQGIARALSHARKAAYARMNNRQKAALDALAFPTGVPDGTSHEDRSKARQRAIQVGNGDHIAQLSLFFWKRLFSADYEATLWKRSLRRLFPDKSVTRAAVATAIEAIYVVRNRLAHHEPIMGRRLVDAMAGLDFIVTHFEPDGTPDDSVLAKMLEPHRVVLERAADDLVAMVKRLSAPPDEPGGS